MKHSGWCKISLKLSCCVCVVQEASELSSLKPELEHLGVPLYAVVKENVGTEVNQFNPHFKGEVFLDEKRRFYGPHKRRMGVRGLFRLGVLRNFFRAWKKGYQGNVEGEGFILGGVFVIGKDKQVRIVKLQQTATQHSNHALYLD
ncbi:F213A protein, partial [Polyodon spathula]|nr:F213A protein [Polyodon spathula]